jgi:acyl carrier protein
MDKLLEILREIRPDIDFAVETALIDDELLDSFDIVAIVVDVMNEFDIEINVEDLLPENFNSAAAIWALIERGGN